MAVITSSEAPHTTRQEGNGTMVRWTYKKNKRYFATATGG